MPKLKQEYEDDEDEDSEQFDEEDLEEEEIEKKPIPRPYPKTYAKKPVKQEVKEEPKEVKRRYGIIAPQPLRMVDAETNEVVGEGEYLIPMALTDIIERLERIENSIGSIMEGN